MSYDNPFRNAIRTFDLLPDALKPAFHTAFNDDWSDLSSNGNPLEHGMDPALHPDEAAQTAIGYVLEWAGWMCDESSDVPALLTDADLSPTYKEDPVATREYFRILADAYDLIPFSEPIESTFGGEHISTGHFLEILPDEIPMPDHFAILVTDDDYNPVTHQFIVEDNVVIYKGRDA